MKKIPYLSPVAKVELDGTNSGEPPWDQYFYFLDRMKDATYTEGMSAGEAVVFIVKAQAELEEQRGTVAFRGFWVLEDARAAALLRSCQRPVQPFNARFARPLFILNCAVEQMSEFKLEPAIAASSAES